MKKFKFEIKEMQEDGTFVGIASMYGNIDLGGDVVERGAFSKTLNEKKQIPLLWHHKTDMPIGIGELEDSDNGLMIRGKLNLEVEKAREVYALIKQGAIKGLSIGYDVLKDKWEKGIRYLKELRLWEVSVVTFPMNPEAMIVGIKEDEKLCGKKPKHKKEALEAVMLMLQEMLSEMVDDEEEEPDGMETAKSISDAPIEKKDEIIEPQKDDIEINKKMTEMFREMKEFVKKQEAN